MLVSAPCRSCARGQHVANNLFPEEETPPNELVFRVQPDEAVYVKLVSKEPGLSSRRVSTEMDLT